jgi:hypothetical protein
MSHQIVAVYGYHWTAETSCRLTTISDALSCVVAVSNARLMVRNVAMIHFTHGALCEFAAQRKCYEIHLFNIGYWSDRLPLLAKTRESVIVR